MANGGPSPITADDGIARLRDAARSISAKKIVAVSYLNLLGVAWPGENASGTVDEVDMGVAIRLEDGSEAVIEWATEGVAAGLDLRVIRDRDASETESDVSAYSE